MCEELKERFEAFTRRDLYEIRRIALFLDATFISVRPNDPSTSPVDQTSKAWDTGAG